MGLWNSWIYMSLLSAAAWGLSSVIDVCFVGEGIYRKPSDGALIAGLSCIVPLFVFDGAEKVLNVDPGVAVVALLSAICYLLHIYFYFKGLFRLNDASNAEIFNTLSVLFVPLLAFVFLGEILEPLHYVAIGVAIIGISFLVCYQLSRLTWRVAALFGISVLFVSLTMVMQAWVLRHVDYPVAVWLFSFGAFITVVLLLTLKMRLRQRVVQICKRFGALLVVVQLLELSAVLGSQRATDLGPSVSLVALLECSLPVFVMAFSWMIIGLSHHWRSDYKDGIRLALASQTDAYPSKLMSLAIIIGAIFLSWP